MISVHECVYMCLLMVLNLKFKKITYFVVLRLILNILSMKICYEFSKKGINEIGVETDAIVPLRKLLVSGLMYINVLLLFCDQ